MSYHYLDTSVALHALQGTPRAVLWFDQMTADEHVELVSSRLLQTELTRALRREGLPVVTRDVILEKTGLVPVSEAILTAAEVIGAHVKTLDAIHLATALALGSATEVVSHDANLKRVAVELGLAVADPLEPTSA